MRARDKISPYPILNDYQDDYINSSFRADIEVKEHFSTVTLDVHFRLRNPMIQQLISEGKAAYLLHVECPALSLRHEILTAEDHLNTTIESDDLAERLEICTFIVVQEELAQYTNPCFHPDYQGRPFRLMKGQILAIGDAKEFDIEKTRDKLKSLPSIIRIARNADSSKGTMTINTDNPNYISVGLTEQAYQVYSALGKREYPKAILSMVLFPALLVVFQRVSSDPEAFSEHKWFEVLSDLLENNGHSWDEMSGESGDTAILAVTQAIFANPIEAGLKELQSSMEGE